MQHIPVKLKAPKNSFNNFEDNQVLTAEQLNHVVQYFDYQERLTRARLLGVGIVCGLNLVYDKSSITVTKGVGVTSDGDLIVLDADKVLVAAKELDDTKANYSPFEKLKDAEGKLRVSELVSSNEDATALTDFFTGNNQPQNTVVLAYVSQYTIDTDQCTVDECENKGLVHHSELKFIAISRSDYDLIDDDAACCGDEYFSMPDVSIPRVLLNENDNVFSYADFVSAYRKQIIEGVNELQQPLTSAIKAARTLSACMMESGVSKDLPRLRVTGLDVAAVRDRLNINTDLHAQLKNQLGEALGTGTPAGIQYVYDFIKELADAYHEFREKIYELCHSCCYDAAAFPKHLAIGLLIPDDTVTPCAYRHCFLESPLLNHKDDQLQEAVMLYMRLVQMISTFTIPSGRGVTIRITPSKSIAGELSSRAIPYYYNAAALFKQWAPQKTFRRREQTNLGYHADSYSSVKYTREPLRYNTDEFNFFRIEGHLGKTYEEAFRIIEQLRKQFDLPFEVTAVQLQRERRTIVPPKIRKKNWYDLFLEREKFGWSHQLDHIRDFGDKVIGGLPTVAEVSAPELRKKYNTVQFQDPVQARSNVETKKVEMQNTVASTKTMIASYLPTAENETPAPDFVATHQQMTNIGASFNKSAKLLLESSLHSPVSNMAVLDHPYIIDWIGSYIVNTENKIKDGYIFNNFLKHNQSMLHNAGVCRGGTFVLLYDVSANGRTKTIVGDFYLPYICKEDLVDAEVDPGKVPVRPFQPIDVGVIKDFIKVPFLNNDLLNIKEAVDGVNIKVATMANEVVNVREGIVKNVESMVKNYQTTFGNITETYTAFLGDVVKLDKTKAVAGVAGLDNLMTISAETFKDATPDRIRLAAEKVKELQTIIARLQR
jgi:hypothetical protein